MSRNTYYKTCSDCGANLDPGETCDCSRYEHDVQTKREAGSVPGLRLSSPVYPFGVHMPVKRGGYRISNALTQRISS